MLEKISFSVPLSILEQAKNLLPQLDFRLTLNEPTGRFFYDPWKIKKEFKNTVWETILNTISGPIGEARIIQLHNGTCYMSHCDIDDRYHLNIEGQYSFLIDIDNQQMFPTTADGNWYSINTGHRHVAANFGSYNRTQLVVRKLLNNPNLQNARSVTIKPISVNPRFEFDDIVSPWLNKMNKLNVLKNFDILPDGVRFDIDHRHLNDLELFPSDKFKIDIK